MSSKRNIDSKRKRCYSSSSDSSEEKERKNTSRNNEANNFQKGNRYLQSGSRESNQHIESGREEPQISSCVIPSDVTWLQKALKRAKEQAVDENKSLEEIAAQRWGSLDKFYSLLKAAEGNNTSNYSECRQTLGKHRDGSRSKGRERRRSRSRERRRSRSRERRRSRSRERRRSRDRNHRDRSEEKKSVRNKMKRPTSDDEDNAFVSKSQDKFTSSSVQQGWRKKKDVLEECKVLETDSASLTEVREKVPIPEEKEMIVETEQPPPKILNDQELNKLAAKLTKAELLGNDALVQKLKLKLDASRQARDSAKVSNKPEKRLEEQVLLTKTMPSGYTVPVYQSEAKPVKKTSKMTAFLEENRDLKQMFAHEKGTSAEDQNEIAEAAALQMGATMEEDYDDVGGAADALHKQIGRLQDKQRQRAILEHQANEKSVESCRWCMTNKEMQKHLVVAIGTKCYVALLPHEEMAKGQCIITPIHHVQSSLLADEDLWSEIMDFRNALVRFYESRGEDCVFFETYIRNKSRIPHMLIHSIPLPREVGDLSPIYFKKAIDECEAEWAQNKKLVDLKGKGVRNCVPKGLSYFFVDFGTCPGYAHVIEDERTFPRKFAEEIIGGMLDEEAFLWLRPPKQSFDVQCKKVMQFTEDFKPFDPNSN